MAMLILSSSGKQLGIWAGPCKYIHGSKKQNHQCRRDSGLPETIKEANLLATKYCEEQFRYDRWNCSIETKGKKNLFKKVNLNITLQYNLTALSHSVARACADGRMMKCQCANERRQDQTKSSWRWGGCSDNVGIITVMSNLEDKCKCHGVSGSCSMRTCWRKLNGFNITVNVLRQKYFEAKRKIRTSKTKKRNTLIPFQSKIGQTPKFKTELISTSPFIDQLLSYHSLYYLEPSPTFCSTTKGRQCLHPENCNMLCCGRSFTTREVKTKEKCKCRFKNNQCCQVVCDYCEKYEDRYYCN
uniref:Protein Wnt n=1 Tax=Culicoides sonorensis TaxID=179676 RepID=A0A336LHT8_CULSO